MAFRTVYRWLCVALLLIATALLLVTTVSAPVVKDIGILKVLLTNETQIRHSSVVFGAFGHCVLDVPPDNTDQDLCFPRTIGYSPAKIMASIDGGGYSYTGAGTADRLTNALVLHPVAAGLSFIAFILALFPSRFLPWVVSLLAILAWVITIAVMAIDFALFGIIKNHVNSDGSGSNAYYSYGMWTCLAAMIVLIPTMLFGCLARTKSRRQQTTYDNTNNAPKTYY